MVFNENARVKIPALLHLTRLGYEYMSLKSALGIAESDANIFIDIFTDSLKRLNPTIELDTQTPAKNYNYTGSLIPKAS